MLAAPLAHLAWQQLQPALPGSARRLADGFGTETPEFKGSFSGHEETPVFAFGQTSSFGGQAHGNDGKDFVNGMSPADSQMIVNSSIAGSFLMCTPPMLVILCLYKMWVTNNRPVWPAEGSPMFRNANKFSVKPFQCCEDMDTCLHGFCCGPVRIADTVHATGIMNFWIVVLVLHAAGIASGLVGGALLQHNARMAWLNSFVSVAVMVFFRQKLRQKLSGGTVLPFRDAATLLEDFAMWFLCCCCAAIQEAREVDQATGVKVGCCCKFKASDQQFGTPMAMLGTNLVGDAVRVDG
eukprot:CAMPEP_0171100422 /NCGR_PEP_ID=MMETSP0766_2-20121228/52950_1 /TAXON_ID=439317 /ORGANISM="Gambierdiscus australes, Strain CAWD 149" /LENGTH=294 /DNA_ID=CAMNT_0011560251 /DNA_START=65 /DNA_END=949 /DNA_ORIENTATION=+